MHFITTAITVLLLPAAIFGASVPEKESKDKESQDTEKLKPCCYEYTHRVHTTLKYKSTQREHYYLLEEDSSWCQANILRDAEEPNNCEKAHREMVGGYCDFGNPFPVVDC
ncbi:hypothetical protein CTRI78_v003484 [Colletotrichum trifolii]|uniref:Uncharacterized protein n=1 Tax=Colletotrichum trifolii TaxID=5466 RepID=A0A4R8RVH5_COLTR|nr:hypothetical protein CTRI78_v003484 [Colletotrichum trifolii]